MAKTETGWGGDQEVTTDARAPGKPIYVSHGSGQITIELDENNNGPGVKYAIEVEEDGVSLNYIQSADRSKGALSTKDFQTASTWTSTITLTGLDDTKIYRFRAYSQNEIGEPAEGTVGSWSNKMITALNIDWSTWPGGYTYDVVSGNTCLLYTSPSPRDLSTSRMPSSA